MLITTLPAVEKQELIERMYSHPDVAGARYNVGTRTTYQPGEIIAYLKEIADSHDKPLWIDLKGRQLRITDWAHPTYGDIKLNHEIEVDLPATMIFKDNNRYNCTTLVGVDGNRLVVDPDPEFAVGEGQSLNIIGTNFKVKGDFLTGTDRQYIEAAKKLGIHDYMLSFVEQPGDLEEVKALDPEARLVLKIESQKGLTYTANDYTSGRDGNLMAARDDLMVNIGENKSRILKALELIVEKDPDAIAASHIFNSLSTIGYLAVADVSDLKLLHNMGYRNFMLSDEVSHRFFDGAMKAWQDFKLVQNG
jgi:pyruvate kinase